MRDDSADFFSDAAERADRVAVYRRSLLYRISNGLESQRRAPLAGMQRYWPGSTYWTTFVADAASPDSRSSTHSGFDHDPETMNDSFENLRPAVGGGKRRFH